MRFTAASLKPLFKLNGELTQCPVSRGVFHAFSTLPHTLEFLQEVVDEVSVRCPSRLTSSTFNLLP